MTCVESRHTISGSITQPHRNQKFPLLLLLPHLLPQTSLHHFEHPPKKNDHFYFQKNQIIQEKKKKKPLVSWENDDLPGVWLTGPKTRKKRRQPWPRCVHPGERERETCWRDSFIRLSHVSCCCYTGRYDGATPNSGWPVREIQALSKKGISLPTWATHAKKTHTQEREGETRCRQITAAHKVGQTGGGGFDVVQKKLCTEKRKWPTHTHVPGTTLGLDVCTRPKNMCLQSHPGNLWKGK